MGSSFWNAWLNKGFPVNFQATSAKDLFITKGWSSPFGFFRTPEDIGGRRGWENDIAWSFGYQGSVCHAGVISITVLSTFWINENWGNAYRISWFYFCCIAYVAKLCWSGFQGSSYLSISLVNLEANWSITDISIFWQICWNTTGDNFHFKKSLLWQDCPSFLVFRISGRYSVVILTWFNIRYFQMSLLKSANVLSVIPPIFSRYERTVVLSVLIWVALIVSSFVKAKMAFFTARSYRIFIFNFLFSTEYFPQSS